MVAFHCNTAASGMIILAKVYFSFLLVVQPAVIPQGKSSPRKEEGRLFKEEQFGREQLQLKPKPGLGGGWNGAISGDSLPGYVSLGPRDVCPPPLCLMISTGFDMSSLMRDCFLTYSHGETEM